eukprot:2029493-Pleurochrysis_carterae.AAC.3
MCSDTLRVEKVRQGHSEKEWSEARSRAAAAAERRRRGARGSGGRVACMVAASEMRWGSLPPQRSRSPAALNCAS